MDENKPMAKKLGGYPYSAIKRGDNLVLRFYPKSPFALKPERVIFTITLTPDEREKIMEIFSKV